MHACGWDEVGGWRGNGLELMRVGKVVEDWAGGDCQLKERL